MAMFDFHWRDGEFEVRTTNGVRGEPYVELIHWYESGDGRECCVKQIYFEGDNVRLHSLNKAYADIIVERKYVVAIHRVVQAWINMKVEF